MPVDALNKALENKALNPVTTETGWAIFIRGQWHQFQDGARLYRSEASAKSRFEAFLVGWFESLHDRAKDKFWTECLNNSYPHGLPGPVNVHAKPSVTDYYKSRTKAFRMYMKELYNSGTVTYRKIG